MTGRIVAGLEVDGLGFAGAHRPDGQGGAGYGLDFEQVGARGQSHIRVVIESPDDATK